jgi:hypothetical protein
MRGDGLRKTSRSVMRGPRAECRVGRTFPAGGVMAKNATVGAHSCGINPEVKDAGPRMDNIYGRTFPGLSPCGVDEAAMIDLGRAASCMDATLPVVDEGLENRRIPAGFVVLGQFVAHDITADRSLLAHHAVAGEIRNFRSPRLDPECLYGEGPVDNPSPYDADKLLLGVNAAGELDDLPRNSQGVVLLGTRATTCTWSSPNSTSLASSFTTAWWIGCATGERPTTASSTRRTGSSAGTTSGSWSTSSFRSPPGTRLSPTY